MRSPCRPSPGSGPDPGRPRCELPLSRTSPPASSGRHPPGAPSSSTGWRGRWDGCCSACPNSSPSRRSSWFLSCSSRPRSPWPPCHGSGQETTVPWPGPREGCSRPCPGTWLGSAPCPGSAWRSGWDRNGAGKAPHFHHHRFPPTWGFFFLNFPLALVLGWFLAAKERAEASGRELKALADQARAQALQAQLSPHVLFNVLSGLTELVHEDEDADAAEEALVGLTELYRRLTTHGSAIAVPLQDERDLVEQYLELEEIRLGERLAQEWEWPRLGGWPGPAAAAAPAPGGERHQARHLPQPRRRDSPGVRPATREAAGPDRGQHGTASACGAPRGHGPGQPPAAARAPPRPRTDSGARPGRCLDPCQADLG